MTRSRLDSLVERARTTAVRGEVVDRALTALDRVVAPPPAPWWRWVALGAVGVAAALAVVLVRDRAAAPSLTVATRPAPAPALIELGDRVAIVAAPGTQFRVVDVALGATTIDVVDGSVTARLWPGSTPHRLLLRGAGVAARATGTVYTLTVAAGAAEVDVHEGAVQVESATATQVVTAGQAWAAGRVAPTRHRVDAATRLAAAARPTPVTVAPLDAGSAIEDAPVDPAPPDRPGPSTVTSPPDAAPPLSAKERYRRARLLRAQGDPAAALRELTTVVDTADETWAPLALVELVRTELEALAAPERAIVSADRFIARYPAHALVAEVRTLRCRARTQLGQACP